MATYREKFEELSAEYERLTKLWLDGVDTAGGIMDVCEKIVFFMRTHGRAIRDNPMLEL